MMPIVRGIRIAAVLAAFSAIAAAPAGAQQLQSGKPIRLIVGLAAGGGNPDLLARQRAETGVTSIAVADPVAADKVGDVTYSGPDAVTRLVQDTCENTGTLIEVPA